MTFYIYRGMWASRAHIFARAATDTLFGVHHRNFNRSVIVGVTRHHLNGSHGAMSRAVAAIHIVGEWHAVFSAPHGMTYLCARLLSLGDGLNGSGRAYIRASCTLWATEATVEVHFGLHKSLWVARWAKHAVGAF